MILKIIDGSYNPQNPVGPTELVLVEHVFILRLFHLFQMLQIELFVKKFRVWDLSKYRSFSLLTFFSLFQKTRSNVAFWSNRLKRENIRRNWHFLSKGINFTKLTFFVRISSKLTLLTLFWSERHNSLSWESFYLKGYVVLAEKK